MLEVADGARAIVREKIAAHLAHARGATLVPSFDDPWVIEGQGSSGIELQTQMIEMGLNEPSNVLVPCGGGGRDCC